MEWGLSRWANIASIVSFVSFAVLTLIDRWSAIEKWGESSMLLKISFVVLILGVIFAGIAYYLSRNKPRNKRMRVIRNPQDGAIYLVDGKTCSHIPDMATFNYLKSYFGLASSDIEAMLSDEMKRIFSIKGDLPSIKLHFPQLEP